MLLPTAHQGAQVDYGFEKYAIFCEVPSDRLYYIIFGLVINRLHVGGDRSSASMV